MTFDQWLHATRGKRFSSILVFCVFLGVLASSTLSIKADAAIRHGDYLSFYAASTLVKEGKAAELYNWELQKETQNRIVGEVRSEVAPFAYPPIFALVLLPFAYVPIVLSKWLWVFCMLACFYFSLRLLRPLQSLYRNLSIVQSTGLMFFVLPLALGVVAGQNVTLSILIYALTLRLYWNGTGNSDSSKMSIRAWQVLSGAALGLWLFKPQYVVLVLPLLILRRDWSVLLGFFLSAAILYIASLPMFGFFWPLHWLEAVVHFGALDDHANANKMISIQAVTLSLFGNARFAQILGGLLYISLLLYFWNLRSREVSAGFIHDGSTDDRLDYIYIVSFGVCVAILCSPHALFYDFAIFLMAFSVLLGSKACSISMKSIVLLVFCVSVSTLFRYDFMFQPLFILMSLAMMYLFQQDLKRSESL